MRFSIALELALTFGLMVVLSAVNAWVGTNGIDTVVDTYEEGALRLAETARLSEEVEKYTLVQANAFSSYMVTGDPSHRADFEMGLQGLRRTAATLRDIDAHRLRAQPDRHGDGAAGGVRGRGHADFERGRRRRLRASSTTRRR